MSGKGRVAVHEQRKIFFASTFAGAVLFGACASDGDRINSFEMAGVRNQVDIDLGATARDVLAGRPQVVLHVAGAQDAARIDVFKCGEDFFGRPPGHVQDDIEAPPVTHAHDEVDGAALGRALENFVYQRQEGGVALEREAFGAEVALL